ncbi:hypothetical protein QUO07_004394 [Vibrio parahaemolyticus]|nr:hypothetical protein [Vibrio parahaemolyticus]EGQ7830423.1 hypothetical protein [Vibrio parahaemolyticus]EHH1253270.1 hypothetical protein [Vibrio parahaemolyticus]EHR6658673.1 hypothetical protein [Vibrio parahaemolyticus]EJG2057695.1 hypothetical protein [Vibrio parahaemolyticus]EJQ9764459.1 hypothetical protein [Vibrio parahaemolyticus]
MSDDYEYISIKDRLKSFAAGFSIMMVGIFLLLRGADLITYLAARYNW